MSKTRTERTRKRVILHVKTVLEKLAKDLGIGPDDTRYAISRLHHEGLPFVTKTLPQFAKFAVRCCDQQALIETSSLTSFRWDGRSPRFLRGLLLKAIEGCAISLRSIRQFCEYFYKTSFGFENIDIVAAQRKYISVDQELSQQNDNRDLFFESECRKTLHHLFPRLCEVTPSTVFSTVRPHDGPGSFSRSRFFKVVFRTPQGEPTPHELIKKFDTKIIGSHLKSLDAFSGYFRSYPSSKEALRKVSEGREAELCFVPKDSRGPRTISMEPLFHMKAQMAAGKYFASELERQSHWHINFASQEINQALARESSVSRKFATLDLKDASDRVRKSLVDYLFEHTSALRYFCTRVRSTHVLMPDGTKHRLVKFANMGSGLCFPILALVVALAAVTAIRRARGCSSKEALTFVYVYGDDLIVPTEYVKDVIVGLQRLKLVVNEDKSFSRGYFRESCGGDYYHGIDVGPVRLRLAGAKLLPVANYRNGCVPVVKPAGLLQLERHCRELVDASLYNVAKYYYKNLQRQLPLPKVSRISAVLGIYDPDSMLKLEYSNEGFVPEPVTSTDERLSPHKLMAPCLAPRRSEGPLFSPGCKPLEEWIARSSSSNAMDKDPYQIPLRYAIKLKKCKVLEPIMLDPYGVAADPRSFLMI